MFFVFFLFKAKSHLLEKKKHLNINHRILSCFYTLKSEIIWTQIGYEMLSIFPKYHVHLKWYTVKKITPIKNHTISLKTQKEENKNILNL